MNRIVFAAALTGLTMISVAQAADKAGGKHPNLVAAQGLLDKAAERITDAQKANDFDLGGHAKRAKELLDEANAELKMAIRDAGK